MNIFLSIQNTYETIEVGLFSAHTVIDTASLNKLEASRKITLLLDNLLKKNFLQLSDISFIAANQGPGPFTTLRVVLTTVNAIQFSRHIPLIGIDGLHAILAEYKNNEYPNTVALLDAFNKDVYFGIQTNGTPTIATGYKNYLIFLDELKHAFADQPVRFIGNATQLYLNEIQQLFGKYAIVPDLTIHHCSIEQIGIMGWQQWQQKNSIQHQLLPLYLKKHSVEL